MKGKPKSKFDYKKDCCKFEEAGWCKLPKGKRCSDRLPCGKGEAGCMVML